MAKKVLSVVIPGYNEGERIGKVLKKLFSVLEKNSLELKTFIIMVDDGSTDNTFKIAKKAGAIVLHHPINRGVGAATVTGFEKAKMLDSDFVITMDADDQHEAKDIFAVVNPVICGEADCTIGSRFLGNTKTMPLFKKIGNILLNIFVLVFYGWRGTDTMCGFRAFNRKALDTMNFRIDRYGYIAEVYREAKIHNLVLKEVPIETRYDGKRGTTFLDGVKIALENVTRGA